MQDEPLSVVEKRLLTQIEEWKTSKQIMAEKLKYEPSGHTYLAMCDRQIAMCEQVLELTRKEMAEQSLAKKNR